MRANPSSLFLSLLLVSPSMQAAERELLFNPLKVRGERGGTSISRPGEEVPLSYLPCTFQISIRATDATEAWNRLVPQFDEALRRMGLQPVEGEEIPVLSSIPASHRLRDSRVYRCGNPGAMERMRRRLVFVNQAHETKGWIRQILVGLAPVPDSAKRGSDANLWRDEYGLRVYIVGRPEHLRTTEDLPFDATPLMNDLADSLVSAAR